MSEDDYLKIATRVLFTEARLLDQKKFRDWVKLYAEDAIFWVPAWKDEYETTSNPNRELSMIYHENSYGLSDRIDRIQSRKSITAMLAFFVPMSRHGEVMMKLCRDPASFRTVFFTA